jgi:peptidyl-tRNA hydrolase
MFDLINHYVDLSILNTILDISVKFATIHSQSDLNQMQKNPTTNRKNHNKSYTPAQYMFIIVNADLNMSKKERALEIAHINAKIANKIVKDSYEINPEPQNCLDYDMWIEQGYPKKILEYTGQEIETLLSQLRKIDPSYYSEQSIKIMSNISPTNGVIRVIGLHSRSDKNIANLINLSPVII